MLYGVCQTLVNLTNTFDKPDIPDEMKQLGEFAKVKLPKFSEKVRLFVELLKDHFPFFSAFYVKLEMEDISGLLFAVYFFNSKLNLSLLWFGHFSSPV